MKVFSTQRQIRKWLENFEDEILEKHKTIGEFLSDVIIVKNKKFIDKDIRSLYLFKAIQDIDLEKLGFNKEFLTFSKDSEFIFSFLKEIFIERVNIEDIIISDTYIEYENHLKIIQQIRDNYKTLLDENGYVDIFLIDEFEINYGILEDEEIEFYLDGYLSKFDIEILSKIDRKITINFLVSKFNKSLIRKCLGEFDEGYRYKIDFHSKEILSQEKLETNLNVEVSYFSKKFDEINFVFAKIAEFVEDGLNPNKIAVILPDESFSELLEEFDEYKNLNFAMGKSFRHSQLYIKLKALYDFIVNEDEVSKLKIGDLLQTYNEKELLEFIRDEAKNSELKIIDEELFKLERFKNLFSSKKEFLYFILDKLKELTFDDVYSGKITTMGVLESRGMQYDGVIIVNFNEGVVPNVNSKDLFLNTSIRKKANLPTRMDKENLQKHYYYNLIQNSKKVAISYIHNDKESVSRFLYELNLDIGTNKDEKYKEVLYKYSPKKEITFYDETFKIEFPIAPTTLKTLLECPKKYYFSKVLNINNKSEEENFGSVFHEVLHYLVLNKNQITSKNDYYEKLMSKIYEKLNTKKDIYEIRIKYEDSIKEFCNQDFDVMKNSQNLLEEWLRVDNLVAKVDRIDIKEDEIVLIDYKTGSVDSLLEHPFEFQLTFYYLWAKNNYNKKITVGYWDIKSAKFLKVEPKIDELKEVLNNLPNKVRMAQDIVSGEKVVKKAIDICKWCDYKIACARG